MQSSLTLRYMSVVNVKSNPTNLCYYVAVKSNVPQDLVQFHIATNVYYMVSCRTGLFVFKISIYVSCM